MGAPKIVLLDNGSLRPAAVLALRAVAAALAQRVGCEVEPVSLLHSGRIPAEDLEGRAASVLEPWLAQQAENGTRRFLVMPFFLGPSRALSEYVPGRVARLRAQRGDLEVRMAPALGEGETAVERLAGVVEKRVRETMARLPGGGEPPAVAVVDHGSPEPKVTAVRDAVAAKLRQRLAGTVRAVEPCSMERRAGEAFAFSDPLLSALLDRAPFDRGEVVAAMLFISPGRHAGTDGDVARICRAGELHHPGLRVGMTELLGGAPELLELLAERLEEGRRATPL